MPNHVTNRLLFTGSVSDVAALKDFMIKETEESVRTLEGMKRIKSESFDFNSVIQRPTILDRVISPARRGDNGRVMLNESVDGLGRYNPVEASVEEQAELDALPYESWYEWSLANWGTKWNSYDFQPIKDIGTYELTFNTAWSPPEPILESIAEMFPNVRMNVSWFDEGWCHAGDGYFNDAGGVKSTSEMYVDPNPAIYEKVYGQSYDDLELEEHKDELLYRYSQNFFCSDVLRFSDEEGYFPLTAKMYSDDPEFSETELDEIRKIRKMLSF